MPKLLILGGTTEAGELAARFAADSRLDTVTSLAGLTRLPAATGPVRRGGFGGPAGLAAFLRGEGYDVLIDATHPFAAQIAAHAQEAATIAGVPRVKLLRPEFPRPAGAEIVRVRSMVEAAQRIPDGASVFLAAGRRELAPFAARRDITCVIRMIEPPVAGEVPDEWNVIVGHPAATTDEEKALMRGNQVEWVVAKDSGGPASAKIDAAADLRLPIVLIERPEPPAGPIVETVDDVIEWLEQTLATLE